MRTKARQAAPVSLRVRALRMLGRREFTRQELAQRLRAFATAGPATESAENSAADSVIDPASDPASDLATDPATGSATEPGAGPAENLDALLDDLAQRGWLSDARYADALVRKRTGEFARRAIAQQLKQAGVDEDVTAAALAPADPDEEFAAALALCRRKFRRAPADQKEKARHIRFLQSRGYSLSLALRVLKHLGHPEAGIEETEA